MGNNFTSVYIGSFGFTTPDQSMIYTVKFGSRSVPGFLMETRENSVFSVFSCLQSVVFLTVLIVDKETFSSSEMRDLHQGTAGSALSRNFYLIQDGEQTQLYPDP